MSLLDFLRGNTRNTDKQPPNIAVDSNDSGEILYSDDLVAEIKRELERRRGERTAYELQWTLNANFLAGYQNCEIDMRKSSVVTEMPVERADRERRCYNRIAPLMETRDANLGAVRYDMVVNPRTADPDDIAKARVSTALLQYVQSHVDFQRKMDQLRRWMEICGTAFTLSWWDKDSGDVIATEERISVNDEGIQSISKREIHQGDLSMGLLTAYEVYPHSLVVEDIRDQHDVILEQVMDVAKIRDLYGISVDGGQVDTYSLSPVQKAVTGHGRNNSAFGVEKVTRDDCASVITYLENPTKSYPSGRLVVVAGDQIVYYGELPAGIMPIRVFRAKPQAGLFFGKSVIQDLIPLQRTYNAIENKIIDYIATIANNPWLVPAGSLDLDAIALNGIESGAILEYEPGRGKPEIVNYPSPPPAMLNERSQIAQDMEYTAGVSQLMVYGAAASSSSGKALDTRREIDLTRMSMTADGLRDGVAEMAKIWLSLNKAYSSGYRVMQVIGKEEIAMAYTWSADDINSYDVVFAAENELRRSHDQQKRDFAEAYNLGLFTDENGRISQEFKRSAWELFRVGSFSDVMDMDDVQKSNARRENTFFDAGVIPERNRYDDDKIHLEEHIKYALSVDYGILRKRAPEYSAEFDRHIGLHSAALAKKEEEKQKQAFEMQALMRST